MKHLGIEVSVKHVPELDPGFLPLGKFNAAFLKDAKQPLDVAVERAGRTYLLWTRPHRPLSQHAGITGNKRKRTAPPAPPRRRR